MRPQLPVGRVRGHVVLVLWIVAVAVAYFTSAQVGLRMALVEHQVTPFWPPTGIALACLLLRGPRVWPGITLGAFAVNLGLGPQLPAILVIAAGNTAAPLVAYLLLRRVGFRRGFDRITDVLALVFLGALTGMLVSATVGSTTLLVAGALSPEHWLPTWFVWWTGDAMGVLTVAPLILLLGSGAKPRTLEPLRIAEAIALFAGTLAVVLAATAVAANMLFLAFPFLIWAGLRFHLAGTVPCALISSTVASYAASGNLPAFADLDLTTKMVVLQAFNGSVALTALLHATLTAQRDHARRAVDDACIQLTRAVTTLQQGHPLEGMTDVLHRLPPLKPPRAD
ncbi:MASE1 domain-containing protein [Nocardia sp. IFM 10818]